MVNKIKFSIKVKEVVKEFKFLLKLLFLISFSLSIFISCYDLIYQTGIFSNHINQINFDPLLIKKSISNFIQNNEIKQQISENLKSTILIICLLCLSLQSFIVSEEEKILNFFTKSKNIYCEKFEKNNFNDSEILEKNKNLLYRWFIFTSNGLETKVKIKEDYFINLKEAFILGGIMLFALLFNQIKPIYVDLFYIQTVPEKQTFLISFFFDVIVLNIVLLIVSLIFLLKYILDLKNQINYVEKSIINFVKNQKNLNRYIKKEFNLKNKSNEDQDHENNEETLIKELKQAICKYYNIQKINDLIIVN